MFNVVYNDLIDHCILHKLYENLKVFQLVCYIKL